MKCCICGKDIIGYGNNPYPITDEGLCCDECNLIVVMTRLELSLEENKILR